MAFHHCPHCSPEEQCPYTSFFQTSDGKQKDPRTFFHPSEVLWSKTQSLFYLRIHSMGINHFKTIQEWFPPASEPQKDKLYHQTVVLFFDEDPRHWKPPIVEEPSLVNQLEEQLREVERLVLQRFRMEQKAKELSRQQELSSKGLPADPSYQDFYQHEWGSYATVSLDHYEKLRDANKLPSSAPDSAEKVLLFREPGALFFRPPRNEAQDLPDLKAIAAKIEDCKKTSSLSISAVKTVFSVAPDSVGVHDDDYIAVPKKAIRAAKQQLRASREALRALDPYVHSALKQAPAVSSSPAETKIKPHDGFKTPIKSASEPPPPQTVEHTCRKCEASFRSRNALFDHIYSNTCKPSLETPRKSSKRQSFIITANNTPVNQTAPARQTALKTSSSWLSRRLASSTATASPAPPGAPDSHSLFTPIKTRPLSASPAPWEFKHSLPRTKPATPPSSSSPVTTAVKHKEGSQLSTPDGSHGNKKLASVKQTPTPCSCRTCNESFASRNLLFAHLHDHSHCRPDKPSKKTMTSSGAGKAFSIQNTSWRSGKTIQMDFGVLGDIMSKLAAVASSAA